MGIYVWVCVGVLAEWLEGQCRGGTGLYGGVNNSESLQIRTTDFAGEHARWFSLTSTCVFF